MKIGIVGMGLMGGSFAKALKKRTTHHILGADTNKGTLKKAMEEGVIDEVLEADKLSTCDITLLAVRPGVAIDFVKENQDKIKNILIDFCGIKESIEKEILPIALKNGFSYLGGHPMAGKEVGGYENSIDTLYEEASMIFVENETSKGLGKNVEYLFRELGFSEIVYSNSEDHDRIIAYTSQLAHIVSNAYVQSDTHEEEYGFSADSLKDLTRVATLDVEMWAELFFKNRKRLVPEIVRISEQLKEFAEAIENREENKLKKMLHAGCVAKKEMEEKRGL